MNVLTDNRVKIVVALIGLSAATAAAVITNLDYFFPDRNYDKALYEVQEELDCTFYPLGWQRSIVRGEKNMSHCIKRCKEKKAYSTDGFNERVFGKGCDIPSCSLLCATRWKYSDMREDDIDNKYTLPKYKDATEFAE